MNGPEADVRVWHYDGVSALRREARLADDGVTFRLTEAGRETGPFAWASLLANDADSGRASFSLKGVRGWRMGLIDTAPPALGAKLPGRQRYGRWVDRFGLWPASLAFACIAALTVAVVLRTPALVARLVPDSVEQRLGDLMVGDFGRRGCSRPEGAAALGALVQRLDADPRVEVHVVRLSMVNAVTLPGGRIVVFDGLLQAARSPDEVAGVIGHELGHFRHHDVTEALIRQLGLSVLLGGMEGHVGGYTNTLLATAYSRQAEANADVYAMDLLRRAQVSPAATAEFFRRLGKGSGGTERMLAYLNTHPVSADRAQQFTASADPHIAYRPALDADQWAALRNICKGAKEESGFRF
ncbi:M48 family metallopeptidase [Sphingomonas sp.]|uniref:M48 family metallopeptidase n=1 Tax=Sphingomonas sp. TaxID=28214 RepID=UPI003CC54C6F